MPQILLYNVHHHESMGILIVIYFFMSGLSAGAFVTAASCRLFGGNKYTTIEKIAAIATPVLLAPGLLCLLVELGQPLRFFNLFLYFNVTSVASWGAWAINIFMAISVLYAFLHLIGKAQATRPLAWVGLVLAIAVGLYSGLLLYQMRGHDLWHSALVPAIFLASAIASGLAVVLLLSGSVERQQTRMLSKALALAIAVDLVLALIEVLALTWGGGEKAEVGSLLLSGSYSFLFIWIYLVFGLVLPLVVLLQQRGGRAFQVMAAVLVLVGTLTMRYVIVMGGQALPLS